MTRSRRPGRSSRSVRRAVRPAATASARELIKAGKIGTLVWGQAWYFRNSLNGEWNYTIENETTAENIDWERWLGPVKQRDPFNAQQYHRWRKYYRYCAGPLGDLAPHRLHPLMLATGNPEFPVRVCLHRHPQRPYRQERARHAGARDARACATAGGVPQRLRDHGHLLHGQRHDPGPSLYGHKATLEIGAFRRTRRALVPQREFGDEIDPETVSNLQPEDIRVHEKNWFDCIRSGKQPNANIDLAIRVQTVISLAEMSDRLKITCLFDEKTRKMTTDGSKRDHADHLRHAAAVLSEGVWMSTGFAGQSCETRLLFQRRLRNPFSPLTLHDALTLSLTLPCPPSLSPATPWRPDSRSCCTATTPWPCARRAKKRWTKSSGWKPAQPVSPRAAKSPTSTPARRRSRCG